MIERCRIPIALLVSALVVAPPAVAQVVPMTDVAEVAAGSTAACVRTTLGGLRCWGSDGSGQIGDPQVGGVRDLPVDVLGPGSGVTDISAGDAHACAVVGGAALCWGSNGSGRLGDGTSTTRQLPTPVSGLGSNVVEVAAGREFSCARTLAGGVHCWGNNALGQLGNGTTTASAVPVPVSGLASGVVKIAAGDAHACAVNSNGGLRCWGSNVFGGIGDGTFVDRTTPVVALPDGSGVTSVDGGDAATCAVLAGGEARCWGANFLGELGSGPGPNVRALPTTVSGLGSGVADISIGMGLFHLRAGGFGAGGSTCAVLATGALRCWGFGSRGALGTGNDEGRSLVPVDVPALASGVRSVSVSLRGGFACANLTDDSLRCWGNNDFLTLAARRPVRATLPETVDGTLESLAAGDYFTCALGAAATQLHCWGLGIGGQLADGTSRSRRVPTLAPTSGAIGSLTVGSSHGCALFAGAVQCWGANADGPVGDGTTGIDRLAPVPVSGVTAPQRVAAGALHSCAVEAAGTVKCWGSNDRGQVGDGTTGGIRSAPTAVTGLSSITAVALGGRFSCALSSAGAVSCWGEGNEGQLGNGAQVASATPVAVTGLGSGVTAIAAGVAHACALMQDQTVRCWGRGSLGALGNGGFAGATTPTAVFNLSQVTMLRVGGNTSAAITAAGELWMWGDNRSGQLGIGSQVSAALPQRTRFLFGPVSEVAVGGQHACARAQGGQLACWGENSHGELGQGRPSFSPGPIAALINNAPRNVASVTPAANNASLAPRSDASGRFVVFQSSATNLTGGSDGNGASDIFRVDLQTGATERMSVDDAGGEIGGGSIEPAVSADGGLVVFVAPDVAVNKLYGETKSARERRQKAGTFGVFLRNVLTGQTARTLRVGTALAGGTGTKPQISADGRKVVFSGESVGAEGVAGQPNVFLVPLTGSGAERLPQPRECVSCQARSAMGLPTANSDGASGAATVSADGTWIAYETSAKNQVDGTPSPCPGPTSEVNLRNMLTGVVRRVSPPPGLPPLNCGVTGSGKPSIDWSGLNLAFQSDQAITPGAMAGREHVFAQFGQLGIARLSEAVGGVEGNADATQPAISGDGTTVAYVSAASNLDASFVDGNGRADTHVRRQGRGNERLSKSMLGTEADQDSNRPALNYNGTRLVFDSAASNLVSGDVNAVGDVFQRAIPAATDVVFGASFE